MEIEDNSIIVTAYKESGKFYSDSTRILSKEHQNIQGFLLEDLIRKNDPEIHKYSPVNGGFNTEGFIFTIQVNYPDNVANFCQFLLNKKK